MSDPGPVAQIYPGWIASLFKRSVNATDAAIDQHQGNGTYGAHQLRVTLPGDPTTYRVIIAPADAPIFIGKCPVDEHFIEPITAVAA